STTVEERLHVLKVAMLGQDFLPRFFTELEQKSLQENVIQRSRDGVRGEAEEAQGIACHFPVAPMGRDDQQRAARKQAVHDTVAAHESDVISPGGGLQQPRDQDDLYRQRAKVVVD